MKILLTLISFLLYSTASVAETIYKSIDDKGNVSYSTTPPDSSEQATSVDISPPPSDERIKAAQDRHERNKEAAGILDENRNKRDEINAKESQKKREHQKQLQQQREAEKNNDNNYYGYPYIPGRRPIGSRPPAHRPVQLPARR